MKCVFGCDISGSHLHSFPNTQQPKLITKWLDIITNITDINQQVKKDLQTYDPSMLSCSKFKVCEHHFKREHRTQSGRIMYGAVPSIHLYAIRQSKTTLHHMEHNYSLEKVTNDSKIPRDKPFRFILIDAEDKSLSTQKTVGTGNISLNSEENIPNTDSAKGKTKLFSWQKDGEIVCDEPQLKPDKLLSTEKIDSKQDCNSKKDKCTDKENVPKKDNKDTNSDKDLHEGYKCDMCKGPIYKFRYSCVQCVNYDLCGACEGNTAHAHHYLLRVPRPRPYAEVKQLIDTMKQILSANIKSLQSRAKYINTLLDNMKSKTVNNAECDPLSEVPDYSFSSGNNSEEDDEELKMDSNTTLPSISTPKSSVFPSSAMSDSIVITDIKKVKHSNTTSTPQRSKDDVTIDVYQANKKAKVDTNRSITLMLNKSSTSKKYSYNKIIEMKEKAKDDRKSTATPQTHTEEEEIIWLDEELLEEHETHHNSDNNNVDITEHQKEDVNTGNRNSVNTTNDKRLLKPRLRNLNIIPISNAQGKVGNSTNNVITKHQMEDVNSGNRNSVNTTTDKRLLTPRILRKSNITLFSNPQGKVGNNTNNVITEHQEDVNSGNRNSVNTTTDKILLKPSVIRKSNIIPFSNAQGKVCKTLVVALPKKKTSGSNLVYKQNMLKLIKNSLESEVTIPIKRLSKEEIKLATRTCK